MPDPIAWNRPLADSVEGRILEKTQERIRALGLTSIDPDRIIVQKLPWVEDETQIPPPYILVTPPPESINWREGTNEKDEVLFAVMVAIVLANTRDVTTRGMGLQLFWRQQLRRAFHNKSQKDWTDLRDSLNDFGDGTFFLHCYIESGDKFIEAAKREQRDASYYLIRVHVREPRTQL